MFKKIIFLMFIVFITTLAGGCKHLLIESRVTKITVEDRTHEYIGREIDKREITDQDQIRAILEKLNDYQKDIIKFPGTYHMIIESENGERVVLRTDGKNFEVISGLEQRGFRYFKIRSGLDLLSYF
jgi:hypothetical protein